MIPISYGELADKITILQIKARRITDPAKLSNINLELEKLTTIWETIVIPKDHIIQDLVKQLEVVNDFLWTVEDKLRDKENAFAFDQEFIQLARKVYFKNDARAKIKRLINELLHSTIIEEKSYSKY